MHTNESFWTLYYFCNSSNGKARSICSKKNVVYSYDYEDIEDNKNGEVIKLDFTKKRRSR